MLPCLGQLEDCEITASLVWLAQQPLTSLNSTFFLPLFRQLPRTAHGPPSQSKLASTGYIPEGLTPYCRPDIPFSTRAFDGPVPCALCKAGGWARDRHLTSRWCRRKKAVASTLSARHARVAGTSLCPQTTRPRWSCRPTHRRTRLPPAL